MCAGGEENVAVSTGSVSGGEREFGVAMRVGLAIERRGWARAPSIEMLQSACAPSECSPLPSHSREPTG